jgi:hypothetical protein
MENHEYTAIESFSAQKVAKKIQELERSGWSVYRMDPKSIFIFASGGQEGYQVILRRKIPGASE